MFIGVLKEIKADAYRAALIPPTVSELAARGHDVAVETCAGQGAGIGDDEYIAAGAGIAATADEIFKPDVRCRAPNLLIASKTEDCRQPADYLDYEHNRVADHESRVELTERVPNRRQNERRVEQGPDGAAFPLAAGVGTGAAGAARGPALRMTVRMRARTSRSSNGLGM
jgi:hypothetical protein